ncbi:MAG TPA: hypothetical protein PLV42_07110 [bacterium]|nr:hypothetical protein [bacterium]
MSDAVKKKEKEEGMREIEILLKTELLKRNIKQVQIAKSLNLSDPAITRCIKGQSVSKRFDAWVLLNLELDLRKIREKKAKAA